MHGCRRVASAWLGPLWAPRLIGELARACFVRRSMFRSASYTTGLFMCLSSCVSLPPVWPFQKPVPTVELVLFHSLVQASSGYSSDARCARRCVFMNVT